MVQQTWILHGVTFVKRTYKLGEAVGEAWILRGDNLIHELSPRLGTASDSCVTIADDRSLAYRVKHVT